MLKAMQGVVADLRLDPSLPAWVLNLFLGIYSALCLEGTEVLQLSKEPPGSGSSDASSKGSSGMEDDGWLISAGAAFKRCQVS